MNNLSHKIIIAAFGILVIGGIIFAACHQDKIHEDNYQKQIDSIAVLHKLYNAKLHDEVLLRDSLRKADKKLLNELAATKKRDSIDHIKDINYLWKKNRALSDEKLDSATKAIYEKVTHP